MRLSVQRREELLPTATMSARDTPPPPAYLTTQENPILESSQHLSLTLADRIGPLFTVSEYMVSKQLFAMSVHVVLTSRTNTIQLLHVYDETIL